MATTFERIAQLTADMLGVDKDKITPQTHFQNDLGADSLDAVELVMEIEEEFDINIPDETVDKVKTVGDAVSRLSEALSS